LAYVAPTLRSVGDAVTAADQVIIANDILQFAPFVQGVFTTETVRDAAITSPTEGMHAYLTAPTTAIVDSTGANTSIPTGVQTIYNGSVWVVVTPVGANTDTLGTTTNGSYTNTLTSGGTNPTVKLVTGTTAMVGFSMEVYNSITGNQHNFASISVTGASSIALTDTNGVYTFIAQSATFSTYLARTFVMTGLTAGINTFALGYAGVTAGTSSFSNRRLWVNGIA